MPVPVASPSADALQGSLLRPILSSLARALWDGAPPRVARKALEREFGGRTGFTSSVLSVALLALRRARRDPFARVNPDYALDRAGARAMVWNALNAGRADAVFVLCSAHGDCAPDHEALQGRLYVDDDWVAKVKSPEERDGVAMEVSGRRLKPVSEVAGAPHYLWTRPNCRHTFLRLSLADVRGMTEERLLDEFGMRFPTRRADLRAGQTLPALHPSLVGRERTEEYASLYSVRARSLRARLAGDPGNTRLSSALAKAEMLASMFSSGRFVPDGDVAE